MNHPMKFAVLAAVALVNLVFSNSAAHAATINADFGATPTYSGVAVAPDLGIVWTGVTNPANAVSTALLFSDGTSSGASVILAGSNGNFGDQGGSNELLKDYVYVNNTSATATVSGLTAPAYDVYLYSALQGFEQPGRFTINAVTKQGTSSNNANSFGVTETNWVKYSSVAPTGGNIVIGWTNDPGISTFGVFSGFQLQAVPEPSSLVLFGFGSVFMMCVARRRRQLR